MSLIKCDRLLDSCQKSHYVLGISTSFSALQAIEEHSVGCGITVDWPHLEAKQVLSLDIITFFPVLLLRFVYNYVDLCETEDRSSLCSH